MAREDANDTVLSGWAALSARQRRLIVLAAAVEAGLKAAMLVDLKRRPSGGVRGPKWLWASSVVINSAGIIPLAYFVVGRVRADR